MPKSIDQTFYLVDPSTAPTNELYLYVGAFVDELRRTGVAHAVICPGSRSTPLALALAASPIHCWLHIDERSAAFFALGLAKRLAHPVALLCTSGTAVANFLPAVIEARLARIPLLVLTADRPPELHDCGAAQTIDQQRIFGSHAKWFVDVALPEATNALLRYIRTLAQRAYATAQSTPAGPVHLNFPFREPLTPEVLDTQAWPAQDKRDRSAWAGRPDDIPYVQVSHNTQIHADPTTLTRIVKLITNRPRGLIIVGAQSSFEFIEAVVQLARYLGYPVLADPLSLLRCGPHEQDTIITGYDAFLRLTTFTNSVEPELILRFGAMPTAKPLLLYLQQYGYIEQIVVDEPGGWEEPTQLASHVIHAQPALFCQDLLATYQQQTDTIRTNNSWLKLWQQVDIITQEVLETEIQQFESLFEGRIFRELSTLLPEQANLYVSNSMPVRDLDTFFWKNTHAIRVLGNRGANGIDGIISSALGTAAADPQTPTVLVIGDLAFLHDLNGFLAAHLHHLHLTVILVNNDGGGIFSFLPQAAYPEHFEQLFGTPTHLQFEPAVKMYGGTFCHIHNWSEFRHAVQNSLNTQGLHVIEVPTERTSNVTMHRKLWPAVDRALQELNINNRF